MLNIFGGKLTAAMQALMKVAITLNTSWNIYNFRLGLIKAFINEGHEVLAIAPIDSFSKKIEKAGCTFVPIALDNTGSNPFKDYLLLQELKSVFRSHRPDIVLNFTIKPNIYGTLAAKQLKIPVINNVSGLGTVFLARGLTSMVAKQLYRWSFSRANLVFFQNSDDLKVFQAEINLPKLKTDLLPGSGINLSHFQATGQRESEYTTFLLIARLIKEKGITEYIKAAKLIKEIYPGTKIQLLGKLDPSHVRGISKEEIDESIQSGAIEYLGEVEDVRPYIANASCVVLPSYGEGTPRTLLEAAALRRPVITTNVAGCREVIVDGETGLMCEVKNVNDLADKMKRICTMSTRQLDEWGKNGRALVEEKFDEQLVISRYLSHMANIMNQISHE
ncbi:MAG: glycosyltransferase family 4 protein [Reichenbachiella sp.]|uniref:glycosyltransferase family 4 protein n=1 Tax=Reichenbachiella sp. TaxID=2184521 RepID=UPI003264588F